MSDAPILVTGANGRTGRALVRALAGRGARVRAFVRDAAQSPGLREVGAVEHAVGDLRDAATVRAATEGCRAVVHVGPPMHVDEVAMTRHVVAAARAAGVERVVYYSVMHPLMHGVPHHERKLEAERELLESGVPHTVVQPSRYMQHLEPIWAQVRDQGVHAMPFGVDARFSVVDLVDLADATARVTLEAGHLHATYPLAGPEALSQRDMAAILTRVLGRPVVARQVPLDELETKARRTGANDARVANMLAMNSHYDRHGFLGNANVLRWLLGREPATFEQYATRLAQRAN